MKDLQNKTVKELRDIAKELNIVGRWNMNKAQLIEEITTIQAGIDSFDDSMIEFDSDCVLKENETKAPEGNQKATRTTDDYLSNVEPGTLIAFRRNKEKDIAMSGKFVSFDSSEQKVLIKSKMGTIFKISRDKVLWVKTGARWPKWVYSMFNNKKEVGEVDARS